MQGWVSFHRKIEEWEWYDDANTFRLFFHLVLKANHKDNKWRGIDIKRGELVTSNEQLAKQLKLTVSKIRTSLVKLKSTGEIAIKTTNKNTVVTVANYELYQSEQGRIADKTTNKSQSNRNQIATNNNDKNKKNVNKEYTEDFLELYSKYPRPENKRQTFTNYTKLLKEYSHEQLMTCVDNYITKEKAEGTTKQYMKSSSNFFGKDATFEDYLIKKVSEVVKVKTVNDRDDLPDFAKEGFN